MSKRAYISRYLLILKKLRSKPYCSYEELESFIDHQMNFYDDQAQVGFSKRTLQRDLKEIRETFGVDIEYSKSAKGYFISDDKVENMNFQRMIEAFDMFNSLNMARDLNPYIHLEKRKPQGTENLYTILHAIKNRLVIRFDYQKFYEDAFSSRKTEPYALKEFKNRWYLISKDLRDNHIKTFALDRSSDFEITDEIFYYPEDFSIEQTFRNAFGIISPQNEKPEEIILSFNPLEGKYIKTLPLHETQEIIIDNDKEFRIKLKLYLTHDFVMELLSLGENMKVIRPNSLIELVKTAHENAWKQY